MAGWTSLTILILLFSGVQLVSIGVIGEYIAKTYMEVKHRPRYLVSERLEPNPDQAEHESNQPHRPV